MTMRYDYHQIPDNTRRCNPAQPTLLIIGVVLLGLGLLLMFLCIPGWAWAILAGIALIAAGYALIRLAIK